MEPLLAQLLASLLALHTITLQLEQIVSVLLVHKQPVLMLEQNSALREEVICRLEVLAGRLESALGTPVTRDQVRLIVGSFLAAHIMSLSLQSLVDLLNVEVRQRKQRLQGLDVRRELVVDDSIDLVGAMLVHSTKLHTSRQTRIRQQLLRQISLQLELYFFLSGNRCSI